MHSCPVCFRHFVHDARMMNHVQKEHPFYQVPQVDIPDTEDYDDAIDLGITFSDSQEMPLDPFSFHDDLMGGKNCPIDLQTFDLPDQGPFFEDSSDHQFPQRGLDDPCRDIITQFIPQSEVYPGAAAILPDSEPTIDDLNWRKNGPHDSESSEGGPQNVFTPCPADKDPRWWPFQSEEAYNFGEWLVTNDIPVKAINALLNGKGGKMPLDGSVERSFRSSYGLRKLIDQMPDGLGWQSWQKVSTKMFWNKEHPEPISFYCRDIAHVGRWLLRQPCYKDGIVYSPVRKYVAGDRKYDEMHTGDWWWETQAAIPSGGTVMPIILFSDATHLTNFSGDKKAWPIYMTIGNIRSDIRQSHKMHALALVALLPVPLKFRKLRAVDHRAQQERNHDTLQSVIGYLLSPIDVQKDRSFVALCADGNKRRIYPRLASWVADFPEHITWQGLKDKQCLWCELPSTQFGAWPVPTAKGRDSRHYRRLYFANTLQSRASLEAAGVKPRENALWNLGINLSDLPKPDLLHTILLGVLQHLLEWIHGFLKIVGRMDLFNRVWLSVPPYQQFPQPSKAYEEVSHWQGKEIREMARFLLGTLYVTLRRQPDANRRDMRDCLKATRGLLHFHFYTTYPIHDESTLEAMDAALAVFHAHKDVFRRFRATKKGKADAAAKKTELIHARDIALEQAKELSTARRREIKDEWDGYIEAAVREQLEEEGDFGFPKLHLLSHFSRVIRRFGSLPQHSTESGEAAHRRMIKLAYQSSNRVGDVEKQLIDYWARKDAFVMRKLNNNTMGGKVAPEGSDKGREGTPSTVDDASVRSDRRTRRKGRAPGPKERTPTVEEEEEEEEEAKTRAKETAPLIRLSGIQNKAKGHVKTFLQLVKYVGIEDLTVEMGRYYDRKGIKYDEKELNHSSCVLFHKVEVPVQQFQTGEWKTQVLRCTVNKRFYGPRPRRDWAWYRVQNQARLKRHDKPLYGALRGRLPVRLRCLFKILLPRQRDAQLLACVEMTTPVDSGHAEECSELVTVVKAAPRAGKTACTTGYRVIDVATIEGAAHLIPDYDDAEEVEKGYVVNSNIDLNNWNTVYDWAEPEADGEKRHRQGGQRVPTAANRARKSAYSAAKSDAAKRTSEDTEAGSGRSSKTTGARSTKGKARLEKR